MRKYMTIENIKDHLKSYWEAEVNKNSITAAENELYSTIESDNSAEVKNKLSSITTQITPNTKLLLINKAILSDKDNREILDILFDKNEFKEVIAEVAFYNFITTIYAFSPLGSTIAPHKQKLSALFDHFGQDIKLDRDLKDYGIKLNNDFVTATLSFAIKAGVAPESIAKVLNNPTFNSLGLYKGHYYELADAAFTDYFEKDANGKIIGEHKERTDKLLESFTNKFKEQFGSDPKFWSETDNVQLYTVDISTSDTQYQANNATSTIDTDNTVRIGSGSDSQTPTSTESRTDTPTPLVPDEHKTQFYYVNMIRDIKANPSQLDDVPDSFKSVYNQVIGRDYKASLIPNASFQDVDKNLKDALLVTSYALTEKDVFTLNKKKDGYKHKADDINKIDNKCVSGTYDDKHVQVKMSLNSAPEVVLLAFKNEEKAVKDSSNDDCHVCPNSPNSETSKSICNHFETAMKWYESEHYEGFLVAMENPIE